MAADAKNREATRDALAALLSAALTGAGNPAQEVDAYEKGLIDVAPLLQVLSGGSSRRQHGMGTSKWSSRFRLVVRVFVPDADTAQSWTEQDVEDRLDLIDKEIGDVIADNRSNATWHYLDYEEGRFSVIAPAKDTGGKTFMMEEHYLIAEVYDA
jgi:hypothetical protein